MPTADATRKPGKAPKRKAIGPKTVFSAITEAAEWGADHTGKPLSAPCACAAQGSGVRVAQGADVEASKHERVADIFQAEASSSANMSNDGAGGSTNVIAGNHQPAEGAEEETKQELVEDAQVAVAEHQEPVDRTMDDPHDMPKASKKPLTRKQKLDANKDNKELKRFESLGDLIAKKMGLEYRVNLGPLHGFRFSAGHLNTLY